MLVREARALAHEWAVDNVAALPGFHGAFLTGSAIWLPDDAPLAPTSDVDIMVVLPEPLPPVKLGKLHHRGLILDLTYLSEREVSSPDDVLGSYFLAPSFARPSIVLDPTGRLNELTEAVKPEYARRYWIRRRAEHGWSSATRHFRDMTPAISLHTRATAWVFGTAAATIVLLVSGLRNPTVRTRYLAVRRLLADYGLLARYDALLDDLGCAQMNRTTVERHLASLEGAFDEAAGVVRTPYAFASDISAAARPISIDGSRDLIDQGYHREAVFWLVATYGRCLHILHQDGTPEQYARHQLGLEGLLADLGIHEPDELERRSGRVLARAPGIWDTAEAILAINADARS